MCLFGGMLTAGAVLRIGMHTFFGWGTKPVTDEAAEVGELPESASEDRRTFWYQFVPAAVCIAIPIALVAMPAWQSTLRHACAVFGSQAAMVHLVYPGGSIAERLPSWSGALGASALRGLLAFVLAAVLACNSVFRSRYGVSGWEHTWNRVCGHCASSSPDTPATMFSG